MLDFDTIQPGEQVALSREITQELVDAFARLSGDDNPLHMDAQFAHTLGFQQRVAHGMLVASYVSTLIGTQLPGPGALWAQQSFRWRAPVFIGDTVRITLTVKHKSTGTRSLTVAVNAINQHNVIVLDGEGVVMMLEQKQQKTERPISERVALVTGASRGIGAATALALASNGVRVIVNYVNNATRAEEVCHSIVEQGGNALAVQADVSDFEAVQKMTSTAMSEYGKSIDILVNNAGGPIGIRPFTETSWMEIQAHFDIQVKGAFNTIKAVLPEMISQEAGCIVNIGSTANWNVPPLNWSGYVISKSALQGLTRSLALEFGPYGVRINMVSPGMTETDLIADIPERLRKVQAMQIPLRRLGAAEDVAQTIVFLCSEAGKYITGADIPVAGGRVM
jgi:3-oxoacyl-[acyl-carrier protein] reductase